MRVWRTLKAQGAAVLRDGVYLMPECDEARTALNDVVDDVHENGGSAHLLKTESEDGQDFTILFDRAAEFGELMTSIGQARGLLSSESLPEGIKQVRKLRKAFSQLAAIDFFPGEAQRQAGAALLNLESLASRLQSPHEPHSNIGTIERLSIKAYQGRLWATRARPWVDRLASAWLIRRFIDPKARLLWLQRPEDCPPKALGFDFDGATFSHVGALVTFETLMASFGLESAALERLGALVHYLDVGGVQPIEASGIERVLGGLRESIINDDQLLEVASSVFDGLLAAFQKDAT